MGAIDGMARGLVKRCNCEERGDRFPANPRLWQTYFRTDVRGGMLFRHDGVRWVSDVLFKAGSFSSDILSGVTDFRCPVDDTYDIWVTDVRMALFPGATNNGSHYWTATASKLNAADSPTTIGSAANTSADSTSTWVRKTITVDEVVAQATYLSLRLRFSKTGAPSDIAAIGEIDYRLIGV